MGRQVSIMNKLFAINTFGWWWQGNRTLPTGPSY